MMSGVITVSGPVTEYKRLSDVLKISENMTRLPETGERWAGGQEPSYLPPAPRWLGSSRKLPPPPPRAPAVSHFLRVTLKCATGSR